MDKLYMIKEKLIDELEKYSDKQISTGTLEIVDKLAHAAKNVSKVIECEEGYSNGSYDMRYGGNRSYDGGSYDGSYDGGSYARGRGRYAKRDSMGRYSSERGYSRDDDLMSKIEMMPEHKKNELRKMMEQM
jgi:hypothetical protein